MREVWLRRQQPVGAGDIADIGVVATTGEVAGPDRAVPGRGRVEQGRQVGKQEAGALTGADVVERAGDDALEATAAVVGRLVLVEDLADRVGRAQGDGGVLAEREGLKTVVDRTAADEDQACGGAQQCLGHVGDDRAVDREVALRVVERRPDGGEPGEVYDGVDLSDLGPAGDQIGLGVGVEVDRGPVLDADADDLDGVIGELGREVTPDETVDARDGYASRITHRGTRA